MNPIQSPVARYAAALKRIVTDASYAWVDDRAPRLGAALAYYAIFSIAPLLIIAIAIAGFVFGPEAAQGKITAQVVHLVGPQGGEAIQAMLESANKRDARTLASILGVVMLVVGAAGLFGQLQDALNTVWGVRPKSGRGIWEFIRVRFLSLSMVLGVAFLLLVSLIVSSVLSAIGGLLGDWQVGTTGLLITTSLDLFIFTLLFALIYRYLPDAQIIWRDVWFGAAVTALLFTIGKFLIGLYLGQAGVGSAYGPAGSLAILLVWLYYTAQIFLFGAELTKAFANHMGTWIQPKEHAEPVNANARAMKELASE